MKSKPFSFQSIQSLPMVSGETEEDILFQKGSGLVKNKQFNEALEIFTNLVISNPSNEKAWVARGVVLNYQENYKDAELAFNQALRLNPNNQTAINNRDMVRKHLNISGSAQPDRKPDPRVIVSGAPDYKSNIILFIWPFIGAFFFFGGLLGAFIFLVVSTVLVYTDAKKLQLGNRPGSLDTGTWMPWEWGTITFLFWIIGYPLYIYKRRSLYEAKNNIRMTATGTSKLLAGAVGFIIILSIIGGGMAYNAGLQQKTVTSTSQSIVAPSITSKSTPYPTTTRPTPTPVQWNTVPFTSYDEVFRNNEQHIGELVKFQGQILQVQNIFGNSYNLRIATKKADYGDSYYENPIWVNYDGSRFLEGDTVIVGGELIGLKQYTSVLGASITLPEVEATQMDLVKKGT